MALLLLVLTGKPGAGKSRMIQTIRNALENHPEFEIQFDENIRYYPPRGGNVEAKEEALATFRLKDR